MEVSKLTISKELAHQESHTTKILRWMQQHPNAMYDTNITAMSQQVTGFSTATSIAQTIERMLKKGFIDRTGGKRRADFYINYYHPQIPPEILKNAPEEVKEAIDHNANIVRAEKENAGTVAAINSSEPEPEKVVENTLKQEAESVVQAVPVEVPVSVSTENGEKKISITINLNLNI